MFFREQIQKLIEEGKHKDFEKELHCPAICRFHYQGEVIGGYILEKRGEHQVNFGFKTQGLHSFQTAGQIPNILRNWNEGLVSLHKAGIRIHQISSTQNDSLLEELEKRADRLSNPTLQFLAYGRHKAANKRIAAQKRCEYKTILIAPYYYQKNQTGQEDLIESKVSWLLDKYGYLNGEKEQDKRKFYSKLLGDSFRQGYLTWKQNLINRFRLPSIKPMTAEELWAYVWRQFNKTEVPPIPHVIDVFFNRDGTVSLKEEFNSSRSLSSKLIGGGELKPSIPYRSKQWNHWIRVKDKYVGAIVYDEEIEGYPDDEGQFKFFWSRIQTIPDSEIVMEVNPANQKVEEFLMRRAARGNIFDIKETEKSGDKNIRAEQLNEEIFEAQRKLLENNRLCLVSVVIYLYRKSNKQLDNDIDQIIKKFPNLCFKREMDCVDRLWLNKLPIVQERLVHNNRQIKMLSEDIPLPVVVPKKFDRKGFELLTKKGHSPIHIDFVDQHRGMLTIATTEAGKTTLTCDIIDYNLGEGIPSVCVDYGNLDGTTSYTDYTNGLGKRGVNIQAGISNHNLIQTPDLRGLSPAHKETHKASSEGFIYSFLQSIVLGDDRASKTAKRVSSLLGYAVSKFYDDQKIIRRFEYGYKGGLGSSDWLRMPTIIDLRDYIISISHDDFGIETEILTEAKQEVLWGLSTFINSRLGQKLSVPSAINVEADFLCISMRQARNADEMALLSLCAQSLAMNQALKSPKCFVILDEGNIMGQNRTVLINIAEFIVNGRKGSIFCNVIMQNIDTLMAAGELGQVIIDNLQVKMIGRLLPSAIPNLVKGLKLPEMDLAKNAGSDFLQDSINLASHWLMLCEGLKIQVSHAPSTELVALLASNPQESGARKRYLAAYDNFWQAMGIFAHDYERARKADIPFDQLVPPILRNRGHKSKIKRFIAS